MKMDKEQKELYDTVAKESPFLREILDGKTTFAESLDQIAAGIEEHDDNAGGAFMDWYIAAALLTQPPLAQDEIQTLALYSIVNSRGMAKLRNSTDAVRVGCGALAIAAGQYLKRDPRLRQIALLTQIAGGGMIGRTAYARIRDLLWSSKTGGKAAVDGYLDRLMETARDLDRDVAAYHVEVEDETFDDALVIDAEKQAAEQNAAFDEALLPEEPVAPEPESDPTLDEWTGGLDGEGRWD